MRSEEDEEQQEWVNEQEDEVGHERKSPEDKEQEEEC